MNPIIKRLILPEELKVGIGTYVSFNVWRSKLNRMNKEYARRWSCDTESVMYTHIDDNYFMMNFRILDNISTDDGTRRGFVSNVNGTYNLCQLSNNY